MGNGQESPLVVAIREAAYSELNHLASLYQQAKDIGDSLSIMQPDVFRQIVANAVQQLSETCLEAMDVIYQDFIQENFNAQTLSLRPSLRMMADLKKVIMGSPVMLEREINYYESCYEAFIKQVGDHKEKSNNNIYNAGTIGE